MSMTIKQLEDKYGCITCLTSDYFFTFIEKDETKFVLWYTFGPLVGTLLWDGKTLIDNCVDFSV